MAFLSILGLYQHDPAIFDGLVLPARVREQKGNAVLRIVEECAELELLFPDWEYMAESIALYSSAPGTS